MSSLNNRLRRGLDNSRKIDNEKQRWTITYVFLVLLRAGWFGLRPQLWDDLVRMSPWMRSNDRFLIFEKEFSGTEHYHIRKNATEICRTRPLGTLRLPVGEPWGPPSFWHLFDNAMRVRQTFIWRERKVSNERKRCDHDFISVKWKRYEKIVFDHVV